MIEPSYSDLSDTPASVIDYMSALEERIAMLEEQLTKSEQRIPFSTWPSGSFPKELEALINKHSIESGSNTPDFILTEYLMNCLDNFNMCVKCRSDWHRFNKQVEGD